MTVPKCACGCGVMAKTRGLSYACYKVARKQVVAGLVTWEQLEQQGKARKPKGRQLRERFLFGSVGGPK